VAGIATGAQIYGTVGSDQFNQAMTIATNRITPD
jgi:hypothetical protein